jgi:hypothetical protein
MPYTCFVSYNTRRNEEVFAYRLQTLAGASGLRVLLPLRRGTGLSEETRQRIADADTVIAFTTTSAAGSVRAELDHARELDKPVIAIHRRGARAPRIEGVEWIEYDERDLEFGEVEKQVIAALHQRKRSPEGQNALLITVLGLGLLALLASGKKSAA